jgi:hypothetical protein
MPRDGALGALTAQAIVQAAPAQAAQGAPVLEGQDNTGATARTSIFTVGNNEWATLADPNSSGLGSLGVYGHGQDIGVFGEAAGILGTGVAGHGSGAGAGVVGTGGGNNATGVVGFGGGSNGGGMFAYGAGSGAGVNATGGASAGAGVIGQGGDSNGIGVTGAGGGSNGTGVQGSATGVGDGVFGLSPAGSGVLGRSLGASGIGVRAENTGGGGRPVRQRPGLLQQERCPDGQRGNLEGDQDRGAADRGEPGAGYPPAGRGRSLDPVRGAERRGQLLHGAPEQDRSGQHHSGLVRSELGQPPGRVTHVLRTAALVQHGGPHSAATAASTGSRAARRAGRIAAAIPARQPSTTMRASWPAGSVTTASPSAFAPASARAQLDEQHRRGELERMRRPQLDREQGVAGQVPGRVDGPDRDLGPGTVREHQAGPAAQVPAPVRRLDLRHRDLVWREAADRPGDRVQVEHLPYRGRDHRGDIAGPAADHSLALQQPAHRRHPGDLTRAGRGLVTARHRSSTGCGPVPPASW